MNRLAGWPVLLAGLLLGAVLPLAVPAYYLHLATEVLILGLLATAFNLLFGGTGLLSFGQAAFFATGAYAAAFVLKGFVASMPLALFTGLVAGAVTSFVVGALSVRRNEIYFAMLTLAFGQLLVEEVETPPGSCPQGCVFASVALPHRNEIAIMRSAHFLWRSCHVQCD